jgi:hypothetical protein
MTYDDWKCTPPTEPDEPAVCTEREMACAIAEAVQNEREAIMQSIEARRARHGSLCDCKAFSVLGSVLDEIGQRSASAVKPQ